MKSYLCAFFVFINLCGFSQSTFKCPQIGESAKIFFARTEYKPIVMAHRMSPLAKDFAENSLETFKYNIKNNPCTIQEIDVRMTKDKHLVLLHDKTLERTTTGFGDLSNFNFKDLKKIALKDANGKTLQKQRIPTFSSILKKTPQNSILVIDKKPDTDVDLLMKEINQNKKSDQVLIICYTIDEAKKIHQKNPNLMLALGFNSIEQINENLNSGISPRNLVALVPQKKQPKDFYEKIINSGIPISFSAQNETDVQKDAIKLYKKLYNEGMKIICTDSLQNIKKAF